MPSRFIQSAVAVSLKYRKTVLAIFAVLLCLAAFRFYSTSLDTSIVSLFPDSSPRLARLGSLLEFNPGARMMFVELTFAPDAAGHAITHGPDQSAAQNTEQRSNQSGGQLSGQLSGQASNQSGGQLSEQTSGQLSVQASGQTNGQANGQASGQVREPDNGQPGGKFSANSVDNLYAAAGLVRERMGDLLHDSGPTARGELPEPQALLTLIPLLFDDELEAAIAPRLESAELNSRMGELRQSLSGPLAFLPKNYVRADPLGLLQALRGKFDSGRDDGIFAAFASALDGGELPVSADGRSVLLVLQPKVGLNDAYGAELFCNRLDAALVEVSTEFPGLSALAVGGLSFTARNTATIEQDLKFTLGFSIALIALIYLFTVRSLGAVWLLLTPVAAIFFAGSAMSAIWPATAGLALGFGAAVLGLAEDYAVLVHFGLRKNNARKAEALARLARPMAYSALLCVSGFCVLMLSSIPALRQMGFFAAFSLVCGLGIALFVLPACPWISSPAILGKPDDEDAIRLRPRLFPAAFLAAVCLAVCVAGINLVPFDASFQNLGADSRRLQQEMHELRSRWQSGGEPQVWVSSGSNLDEALEASAALSDRLRADLSGTDAKNVFALSDLLPPLERRNANIERWNRLVERHQDLPALLDEAASGAGFRAGLFSGFGEWFAAGARLDGNPLDVLRSAGFGELLWWMLQEKGNATHVLSFDWSGRALPDVEESSLEQNTLDHSILDQSILLSSTAIADGLNRAFTEERYLLPLAGAVCLVLLALCFRRPGMILLASLPPLLGLASVIGWLLISGTPMTLPGAAALILVIGLGSDYGIVMLHELRSSFSLGAFKSILVSGLTTLAGLGVLILAEHPVLHTLGGITFFGLGAEMLAVLLIVPFLCTSER